MTQRKNRIMNKKQNTNNYSLEKIARRKFEVLEEIKIQQLLMTETVKTIINPTKSAQDKKDVFLHAINIGFTFYDGITTGLKIIQRIKKYIRKC